MRALASGVSQCERAQARVFELITRKRIDDKD